MKDQPKSQANEQVFLPIQRSVYDLVSFGGLYRL
jgi:hypothetical protein